MNFNLLEKVVLKHVAKKVIDIFPDLKTKGVEIVEKYAEELFDKIEIAIVKFVEEHTK